MDRQAKARGFRRLLSFLVGHPTGLTALTVSLLVAPPIRAQQSQPPPGPPTIKATTDLVLVDVVVKDKNGQHIRRLGPENFTVLEDGKPQKIAEFSLEDAGALAASRNIKSLPKGLYTNRPEYRVPPGPITIFLLDELNTPWADQSNMRARILSFLKSPLRPGGRLALLELGASLRVLQDFTNDAEVLKASIEGYKPKKATKLMVADIQGRVSPASRMADTPAVASAMAARTRSREEFYGQLAETVAREQIETTLGAMRAIGRTLAGFPGRKTLIWFSAAFPLSLPNTGVGYSRLLRETTEVLTNARVAVYPVDVRGFVGVAVFDASNGQALQGADFAAAVLARHDEILNPQGTMKDIASWTGGAAFMNRNDLDRAVEQSIEDGSCYYVLGYYRTDKNQDGKFHKIEVRLDQPGLHARYRRGYYAIAPPQMPGADAIPGDDLIAAMKPDAPLQTQLLVDARLHEVHIAEGFELSIHLIVDPSGLSSEHPPGGKSIYAVTLHIAAYGSDGRLVLHKDLAVKSTVRDDSDALKDGLPLSTQLDLPTGHYHLRIAVRDMQTGHLGTVDAYAYPSRARR